MDRTQADYAALASSGWAGPDPVAAGGPSTLLWIAAALVLLPVLALGALWAAAYRDKIANAFRARVHRARSLGDALIEHWVRHPLRRVRDRDEEDERVFLAALEAGAPRSVDAPAPGPIAGLWRRCRQVDVAPYASPVIGALALVTVGFGFYVGLLLWPLLSVDPLTLRHPDKEDPVDGLAFRVGLLALVGLISLPLLYIRAWVNERQTRTAEQQARLAERGHVTERIIQATKLLGQRHQETDPSASEQTRWVPTIEVRLGAISTLERVAQDSCEPGGDPREHWPIMETMLAYIRQRRSEAETEIKRDLRTRFDVACADIHPEPSSEEDEPAPLPEDVRAAIGVLRRRTAAQAAHERSFEVDVTVPRFERPRLRHPFELETTDLSAADLRAIRWAGQSLVSSRLAKADLSEADLEGADLSQAALRGANLWQAALRGADLSRADLRKADVSGANLREADLRDADLRDADLWGTDLRAADLRGADLRDANLDGAALWLANLEGVDVRHANLRGADLRGAKLDGADLRGAKLEGADLREANLEGATIVGVLLSLGRPLGLKNDGTPPAGRSQAEWKGITLSQLDTAFADSRLADQLCALDIEPPGHWHKTPLEDPVEAIHAWHAWQEERAPA